MANTLSNNSAEGDRCLARLNLRQHYSTSGEDPIANFYSPCARASLSYDRAVGFFRSSVMALVQSPIVQFAKNGGRIRIICSPDLMDSDITAIRDGYSLRNRAETALISEIETVLADPVSQSAAQFVSTLVQLGILDFKLAFASGIGIFHDKLGLFTDSDGHAVSFIGSSNETFSAWTIEGNHESFEVFTNWSDDKNRVENHTAYFERLWDGNQDQVKVVPFPDVAVSRLISSGHPDGLDAAWEQVRGKVTQDDNNVTVLRRHQNGALEAWQKAGYKGIFEHCTGAGKTLTALAATRTWLSERGPVIIVVPSELLLNQWHDEINSELGSQEISMVLAGGGNNRWREPYVLEGFTEPGSEPRVVLTTIQTASSEEFCARVSGGDHLLVLCDEVHWSGADTFSRILGLDSGGRLGLSATPRRFGDPDGTARLFAYFGETVHEYHLSDAISDGYLTPYNYHPHPVELSESESAAWQRLTRQIAQASARNQRNGGNAEDTDAIKMLLIRRARITKKAESKIALASSVLRDQFRVGQRWLVYCEDQEQLSAVLSAVRSVDIDADEYHTGMLGNPDATMHRFKQLGGVLVAIKCLDEGVDIPEVSHALILASSKNPREFVQRRGRVLRVAPDKPIAEIHDALVVPPPGDERDQEIQILKGEFGRAIEFAGSGMNREAVHLLMDIAEKAGIDDPSSLAPVGDDDDEI